MRLVDTHCHLQAAAFDEDREVVVERALHALEWFVVIGDTVASSRAAVAMTRSGVYAAVGIHPHHASDATPQALEDLRALAGYPCVAAIGEIGLDYYYEHAPRDQQRAALRAQLELARQLSMPVVLHCRDAREDIKAILKDWRGEPAGGVMHCFSGDAQFAERCLEWGFHISFAGNCTFPKATALREAARVVPMDRLLVETDSPYLAPQPVRGKRCEPAFVVHTAQLLAELKDLPLETFARQTTENAQRLFLPKGHRTS
jgi:TatD DNase family protein